MRLPELIYVMDLPSDVRESVEELADIGWITVVWTIHERMLYQSPEWNPPKLIHHTELLQEFLRSAGEDIRGWDQKKIMERFETKIWETKWKLEGAGQVGEQLAGVPSFYQGILMQIIESSNRILAEDMLKLIDTADSCFEIMTQIGNIDYV